MFSTKIRALVQQQWAGLIALFLVLTGGVAWASHPGGANTINSADIIDGQVKVADIGQGAVATDEIANNQVKAADIGDGEVKTADIANGQVKTADIGAGEVRSSNVLNDNLTGADVAANSLKGADIDEATLSKTILQRRVGASCPSGQAIRVVGENGGVTCQALTGSSPLGPAGGDLTGNYPNPAIRSNAVTSAKVADGLLELLPVAVVLISPAGAVADEAHRPPVTGPPTVAKPGQGAYLATFPGLVLGGNDAPLCTYRGGFTEGEITTRTINGGMYVKTSDSAGAGRDDSFQCAVYDL